MFVLKMPLIPTNCSFLSIEGMSHLLPEYKIHREGTATNNTVCANKQYGSVDEVKCIANTTQIASGDFFFFFYFSECFCRDCVACRGLSWMSACLFCCVVTKCSCHVNVLIQFSLLLLTSNSSFSALALLV